MCTRHEVRLNFDHLEDFLILFSVGIYESIRNTRYPAIQLQLFFMNHVDFPTPFLFSQSLMPVMQGMSISLDRNITSQLMPPLPAVDDKGLATFHQHCDLPQETVSEAVRSRHHA